MFIFWKHFFSDHGIGKQISVTPYSMFQHGSSFLKFFIVLQDKGSHKEEFTRDWWIHQRGR